MKLIHGLIGQPHVEKAPTRKGGHQDHRQTKERTRELWGER